MFQCYLQSQMKTFWYNAILIRNIMKFRSLNHIMIHMCILFTCVWERMIQCEIEWYTCIYHSPVCAKDSLNHIRIHVYNIHFCVKLIHLHVNSIHMVWNWFTSGESHSPVCESISHIGESQLDIYEFLSKISQWKHWPGGYFYKSTHNLCGTYMEYS
jgi:hypothetical protein